MERVNINKTYTNKEIPQSHFSGLYENVGIVLFFGNYHAGDGIS
ncbi:MAG: hypothetical protein Q8O19_05925 [Rectinemataceae bacterium]|nr:hypothetical protein [Rectinemataceae bacterium]